MSNEKRVYLVSNANLLINKEIGFTVFVTATDKTQALRIAANKVHGKPNTGEVHNLAFGHQFICHEMEHITPANTLGVMATGTMKFEHKLIKTYVNNPLEVIDAGHFQVRHRLAKSDTEFSPKSVLLTNSAGDLLHFKGDVDDDGRKVASRLLSTRELFRNYNLKQHVIRLTNEIATLEYQCHNPSRIILRATAGKKHRLIIHNNSVRDGSCLDHDCSLWFSVVDEYDNGSIYKQVISKEPAIKRYAQLCKEVWDEGMEFTMYDPTNNKHLYVGKLNGVAYAFVQKRNIKEVINNTLTKYQFTPIAA